MTQENSWETVGKRFKQMSKKMVKKKGQKKRSKKRSKNHEKPNFCEPLENKDPWNHAHSKDLATSFPVVVLKPLYDQIRP